MFKNLGTVCFLVAFVTKNTFKNRLNFFLPEKKLYRFKTTNIKKEAQAWVFIERGVICQLNLFDCSVGVDIDSCRKEEGRRKNWKIVSNLQIVNNTQNEINITDKMFILLVADNYFPSLFFSSPTLCIQSKLLSIIVLKKFEKKKNIENEFSAPVKRFCLVILVQIRWKTSIIFETKVFFCRMVKLQVTAQIFSRVFKSTAGIFIPCCFIKSHSDV